MADIWRISDVYGGYLPDKRPFAGTIAIRIQITAPTGFSTTE
jgi:hypothetical protein